MLPGKMDDLLSVALITFIVLNSDFCPPLQTLAEHMLQVRVVLSSSEPAKQRLLQQNHVPLHRCSSSPSWMRQQQCSSSSFSVFIGSWQTKFNGAFPASPGGSQGVPRPDEIYSPSSELWVCPGVSSQLGVVIYQFSTYHESLVIIWAQKCLRNVSRTE